MLNAKMKLISALVIAGMIVGFPVGTRQLTAQPPPTPMTGMAVSGMEGFDRLVTSIMAGYNIPGAALAVVKDGRLVYARGYGLADIENNQPAQPESLFRIGSISKPITAVTVLKLVEEGKLDLDARVFCSNEAACLLGHIQPPQGITSDPLLYDITVRHLLQHSAGWDRTVNDRVDVFAHNHRAAAQVLGVTSPVSAESLISYAMSLPLDFTPGTRHAYSNFGYMVLARVIERVTGKSYEEYAKTVLRAAGVNRMRIGRTLPEGRAEGEVRYYDHPGAPLATSAFPPYNRVPRPYGGSLILEIADGGGGWIASAIDLVRFVTAVDGARGTAILKPDTVRLMLARQELPGNGSAFSYYGLGWGVYLGGSSANWGHTGGTWGSRNVLFRLFDGKMAWAVVFNSSPPFEYVGRLLNELGQGLLQVTGTVKEWPTHDLFEKYP